MAAVQYNYLAFCLMAVILDHVKFFMGIIKIHILYESFLSNFPTINSKRYDYENTMLFLYLPFQFLNQWTRFHKIWYEHYAIENHIIIILYFLQSIIAIWWMHKFK